MLESNAKLGWWSGIKGVNMRWTCAREGAFFDILLQSVLREKRFPRLQNNRLSPV